MKKEKKLSVKIIAEIGIFAAIGYVLDLLQGSLFSTVFPNGGSIGIAMVAVFIISYRRGVIAGVLTGLIMGILDLLDGFYAISDTWYKVFAQVGLDYWIAYPLAGLSGLFKKLFENQEKNKLKLIYLSLGCFVGGILKYLSHFISGVLFWPNDEWGGAITYSLIYNGLYMIPCIIISTLVIVVLYIKQPEFISIENIKSGQVE